MHPEQGELDEMARLLARGWTPGPSESRRRAPSVTAPAPERTSAHCEPGNPNSWLWHRCCGNGKGVFQFLSDSLSHHRRRFAAKSEFDLVTRVRAHESPPGQLHGPAGSRGTRTLARVDGPRGNRSRAEGLDVKAQVAPRPIGVLLGLEASACVFTPSRAYGKIAKLPLAERVEALGGSRPPAAHSSKATPTLTTGPGRILWLRVLRAF
jgi:hypothetical protein